MRRSSTLLLTMDNRKSQAGTSIHNEPIRGSTALLLGRIFLAMVGTDAVYLTIRITFFELNPQWISSTTLDIVFFSFLVFSFIVQILLIYTVLLHWLNRRYYLEGNRLIIRKGIFTTTERTYDLKNLRSVIVTQDLLGKMLNVGTISLVITSPSISEEVFLSEVPFPHRIEQLIRAYI